MRTNRSAACLLSFLLLGGTAAPAQEPAPAPAPVGGALVGQPAPSFTLQTIGGETRDLSSYEGYILVLYFFPWDDLKALSLTAEMEFFFDQGHADEIRYLGVSSLPEERVRSFATTQNLDHELAYDPDGAVTARFLGEPRPAVFIVDPSGIVRLFRDEIDDRFQSHLRNGLREQMHELNEAVREMPSVVLPWRTRNRAPAFAAPDLEGRVRTSAEFRGKPLLVYFFEEDCSHCEDVTGMVRDLQLRYGAETIQVVGVTSRTEPEVLKTYAHDRTLHFPILLDPDRRIRGTFGATLGDPDIVWVDASGEVRWRELGAPADLRQVLDMEAQVLLGTADPANLMANQYVGFRTCRVCHEAEFRDWLGTPHAVAYESLTADHSFRRKDCVPCHVTGYLQSGGYEKEDDASRMSNVQCEACHGPGGGHPAGTLGKTMPWEARCLKCHVGPYVLKQPEEVALKWMNHHDTPDTETLFAYEPARIQDMKDYRRNGLATSTFRPETRYVGSAACRSCHEAIYTEWAASPHAKALVTLGHAGAANDAACLPCHVTGRGSFSGYRGASTPEFAGVGCESCHGPGGDHVGAPPALAKATIYGLAPDCATCQIEPTCRACHDGENDPRFRMPKETTRAVHAARR